MDVDVSELRDIFVDAEQFTEEEDDDGLFDDINNAADGAKFVRAIQESTKTNLICKVFDPEKLKANSKSNNPQGQCWYRQLMLLREVIFLKELKHPAIVDFRGFNLYNSNIRYAKEEEEEDIDKDYTNPTIFLEFLENKSLQNLISNKEVAKLDPVKRQICMIGLSAAVYFLHRKKILHRNLTPKTIWLDENFYPKIFDFSSSRECTPQLDASKTILKQESHNYQAPELLDNSKDYDTPVDIFALGRLLYFFITGYEPFKLPNDPLKHESTFKLSAKIIKGEATPVFPDGVSQELKDLLARCWSLSPQERPMAGEIFTLLKEYKKYSIIDGEFNDEINNYIKKIDDFESELNLSKLRVCPTFETYVDIPECTITSSNARIPEAIPEQVNMLLNIVRSNFAGSSQSTLLELLMVMANNGSILKDDLLPKVINYVNDLSAKGIEQADQFLIKVFGDYVVDPSKTTEILKGTIKNEAIKEANIPKRVTKIGKNAFSGFKNLERVNLPNTVVQIEEEAFCDCPCLITVNIPESVTGENLGKSAFKNCKQLRFIRIPSQLTKIQDSTFKGDKSLSSIVIGSSVETIGQKAFYGCESLKYIEIPKSVKLFEAKAFHHCTNLDKIYFFGKKPKTEKKALGFKVKNLS